MTKYVALLDVDLTLIHTDLGKDYINWQLLNSLKEQGVTDIILFTNMSLNDIKNKFNFGDDHMSRVDLINKLQEAGFIVHDVVTPADRFYQYGKPGDFFKKVYMSQYEKNILANPKPQQRTNDFEADYIHGKVLNDINSSVSKSPWLQDADYYIYDEQTRQMVDKSIKAAGKGYKSTKGVMADILLPKLVEQFGSDLALFYADDAQDCLDDFAESVKRFENFTGCAIPVETCLVSKDLQSAHQYDHFTPLVAFIRKATEQARLRAAIAAAPNFLARGKLSFTTLRDMVKYRQFYRNNEQAQEFLNNFFQQDKLSQRIIHGNVTTWLELANMAAQGTGLYQNQVNLYDAYSLLVLAVLYAESDYAFNYALEQLSSFLEQAKLHVILHLEPSDVAVASLDEEQYRNDNQLTKAAVKTACSLISHLKNHAMQAINITSFDQRLRLRFVAIYEARLTALNSYEALSANEQTIISDEIKRANATLEQFTTISDDIGKNLLQKHANISSVDDALKAASSQALSSIAASSSSSTPPAKASEQGMFAKQRMRRTPQESDESLNLRGGYF